MHTTYTKDVTLLTDMIVVVPTDPSLQDTGSQHSLWSARKDPWQCQMTVFAFTLEKALLLTCGELPIAAQNSRVLRMVLLLARSLSVLKASSRNSQY